MNYSPFIIVWLNPLLPCCLQQIFKLTLVVCCYGPQIVPCVFSFKYGKDHCPFAGIGFYHICKLELELH